MTSPISPREFIMYIITRLVDEPDKVVVDETVDDLGILLHLRVGKNDMGRIIGKEGRTSQSIKNLLHVLGAKSDTRINLKIEEPIDA